MLPFSVAITAAPDVVDVLGGLFLSGGVVYLLSYLFYDRAGPGLGERRIKILRAFLLVAGVSLAVFIISIFLHNVIYGVLAYWFGADFWDRIGLADEPFFFILAIIVCPIGFLVGVVGSVVLFIKRRQQ